ncbi:hypothetical protein GUY61_12060, partial [Streptomyces sp. GC420]|nr:hypothetical protein [Streptomyces sp. GC420]
MCAAALVLTVPGCGTRIGASDGVREVRRLLDRRADAVLDRDEDRYLATVDPRAARRVLAEERTEFGNLRQLPLDTWDYRLTGLRAPGDGMATATVELRYRVDGYDGAPVTAARDLALTERGGRWYVSADRPGADSAEQLWEQGEITAVHGAASLVLGVGRSRRELRSVAAVADRAVPLVSRAWPEKWAERVVVVVPGSLDGMAGLLGSPAAGYRGIAAVTTGEVGGAATAPADRVIVNPEAYDMLGDLGRRIVITHETAHVATRRATSAATPLWLSEGFADWVAYRGSGRTAAQAAPELLRAVRGGRIPERLPADEDFRFGEEPGQLARSYESGWLACRMIALYWGEAKLVEFYRAVGEHPRREGAVERALRDVLGTSHGKFTAHWRAYLRAQLLG